MNPEMIKPLLLSVAVAALVLRRVRRSFGPQALRIGRLQFRIGLLSVIGALVLIVSLRHIALLGALLGGVAVGAALGHLALRHTRFEVTAQGRYYTTHTYIGLLITALFVGRIVYRMLSIYPAMQSVGQVNETFFEGYHKSPLTLAILGVLIGYYVLFNIGVLRKSREPVAA